MKIAYNASAVLANNALFRNDNQLSDSLKRLSSGLKITSGKDNPSGLAMGRRMNAQIHGIAVATQNASDAISVIEIADGAMAEVHTILQRINELAVKSSNEILTDDDRKMIQDEVAALKHEITRISQTTEFNGQKILDGSFDLRGYTNNVEVKVTSYSDYVPNGEYEITDLIVSYDHNGNIRLTDDDGVPLYTFAGTGALGSARISAADGNVITITGPKGFEIKLELRTTEDAGFDLPLPGDPNATPPTLPDPPKQYVYSWSNSLTLIPPPTITPPAAATPSLMVDVVGFGAMAMQIGANQGQQLDIRIHRLSLENMGISNIDVSTHEGALDGLSKMGKAVNYISSARSHMGAYQNRLEHTISNLDITTENMTAAYSRIMDVNMAEEMTKYTTLQILVQASTSMLAQANERPSNVLQLLQ
ncbi:MAG: flagellin FliC3 [Lachnospiraceae bacterium]|nr:flagellin FliC3 [Lachnospiraceae bacterium]